MTLPYKGCALNCNLMPNKNGARSAERAPSAIYGTGSITYKFEPKSPWVRAFLS